MFYVTFTVLPCHGSVPCSAVPSRMTRRMLNDYRDGAVMTEDGRVSILGRIRDVIVRGGESVYPQEVEQFLYAHPAVQEVQVVGVPDERKGEQVCAWIKLKPGLNPSPEDIKNFCKGKLTHYKVPRYILFVGEFPKTVSGKVQKHVIREESRKILHL